MHKFSPCSIHTFPIWEHSFIKIVKSASGIFGNYTQPKKYFKCSEVCVSDHESGFYFMSFMDVLHFLVCIVGEFF